MLPSGRHRTSGTYRHQSLDLRTHNRAARHPDRFAGRQKLFSASGGAGSDRHCPCNRRSARHARPGSTAPRSFGGLTDEEIADAIVVAPAVPDHPPPRASTFGQNGRAFRHPILSRALEVLQNLARKARHTTPYQLLAEAIEELNVRPICGRDTGAVPNELWQMSSSFLRWRGPMTPAD